MSLNGICVAFSRASVTARPEREEETMRKEISLGTAIILAGFLGIALPGCSDRNSSGTGGDAGKSSGSASGSKSSPGSTGAGGSTTGSGTSGSAGSSSGGSGTGSGGSGS
jgi:hypothetical protein